ncbi:unnamed protein product [Auanema sp. JU1783]|nr:unnamed protein product [Auanema sp. JU1783]
MSAFVTVGTTSFDDLINAITESSSLASLKANGVQELIVQYGGGNPTFLMNNEDGSAEMDGMKVTFFRYSPDIKPYMEKAKVVIGHAGAGTIMEALKLTKPFIAVINENLMNNHQVELANALAEKNHLLFCNPRNLSETIKNPKLFTLDPFTPVDSKKVANYVNGKMGLLAN